MRGMAFFRTLFILPMMIAPIAVGLAWRYLFDAQFGLHQRRAGALRRRARWAGWPTTLAFIAIVIADIWQWTPFVFIMMIAGAGQRGQLGDRGRAHRRRALVADRPSGSSCRW